MKLTLYRAQHNERGQALVEFAYTLPIFLALLIGLAAMSLLFYSFVTTQLAVREGARTLVGDPKHQTVTSIQTLVRSKSFALDPNQLSILVEPSDAAAWVSGVQVSVTAVYYVPIPSATVPLIGGGSVRFAPIPIKAQSVMTIE